MSEFPAIPSSRWRIEPRATLALICIGFLTGSILVAQSGPESGYEIYIESNGVVVMEAENAHLADGWMVKTPASISDPTMAGSTGEGWIEWSGDQYIGNTISESAAVAVLRYRFRIDHPGVYSFRWQSKQYDDVASFDAGNDTFVRFASGSVPSGSFDFSAFTKVWVQSRTAWSWRTSGEPVHGEHYHNLMKRNYEAGVHEIQLAARSPGHAVDRLVLHRSDVTFSESSFLQMAESESYFQEYRPAIPVNLSTRGRTGRGASIMIGGFVIAGDTPKRVLVQGVGPELGEAPFNLAGVLSDPYLTLWRDGEVIATCDNWDEHDSEGREAAAMAMGAVPMPAGSKSARLLVELDPGAYTVGMSGTNGEEGIAIFEVYAAADEDASDGRSNLVNLSTRGWVGAEDHVLIGGFVIQGIEKREVLIQGVGPELGQEPFNLEGVLVDPLITLWKDGEIISTNDDWQDRDARAKYDTALEVGALPLDFEGASSRIREVLEPGAYTVTLAGADGGTGIAIIEVYTVPTGPGS